MTSIRSIYTIDQPREARPSMMPTETDEALALNNEMKTLLEPACDQRNRLATAAERIVNDFEELNGSVCKPSLGPCGQCIRCFFHPRRIGVPYTGRST